MTSPLFGLILAGGISARMQRDKATLDYHGLPQLDWAYQLVGDVCAATFVSVRPEQRDEPTRAKLPQIVDRQPGTGPIAGITAALLEHPKAAWLVVACDLPFLLPATLEHLLKHRDPTRVATAYRSAHDGLPEPLCAIWEPSAREPLLAYIASGKQCPRKFLINSNAALLTLPDVHALDNVNTPDELRAANAQFDATVPRSAQARRVPGLRRDDAAGTPSRSITLRVQYYAVLREQAGRSEETLDTTATTPADLYAELRTRHPFELAPNQLKVAINADFSEWHARLSHGDTVVFIPPVAGG
jgi:molybdopterin-guanine dinucleotide biosynthesis protein A